MLCIGLLCQFCVSSCIINYAHTGTSLIANLQCKRNAIVVEKDNVNFIQMKIHVVEHVGKLADVVEDNNIEEAETQ